MAKIGVGIVGAGVRGVYCLGQAIIMLTQETELIVHGVFDIISKRTNEACKYLDSLYNKQKLNQQVKAYASYDEMLDDEDCKIILVTNFTSSHRLTVEKALWAGKKVYLDKPISVSMEDAIAIVNSAKDNPVIMGFTRRYEKSWIKAKELLDVGYIGQLQMLQINSVIPYSRYFQTWHRKKDFSGGALNDKCSHHFDVFNWITGEYPSYLTAIGGRSSVFPVDENAPKSCRECDRDCAYRRDPEKISDGAFVLNFESWNKAEAEIEKIDNCVYAPGADINDHAIVNIAYPSGVKASLFFSIFGPDTKDQEQLILVGEKGKIKVNRHSGEVVLQHEFGNKEKVFDCRGSEFDTSHFGADRDLVRMLRLFYDGKKPVATALDGLKSLEMVIAAQESIKTKGKPVLLNTDS